MLKDDLQKVFLENKDEIITGGDLSNKFNVSRTAIWKAVNQLKQEGYNIESIKNVGYKFCSNQDIISETEIRKGLKTKILGSEIKIFNTINSTNTYLKENECKNGEVVIALHQSKGKGRREREFVSKSNKGIYFSYVLSSDLELDKISNVTICVAVAVTRAIKSVCNFEAELKWVNDIFYKNKKLGGILTEATLSLEEQKLEKLIIGIGLNIEEVADEIKDIATSIKEITDCENFKNSLISEILNNFEEIFFDYENSFSKILDEYKKRLFFLNKEIKVIGKTTYDAVALDLTEKGELMVKDEKGEIQILNSGEISIKV